MRSSRRIYFTCFHHQPFTIFRTIELLTPNNLESFTYPVPPAAYSARMSLTCFSVSLLFGCASPNAGLGGGRQRPFSLQSALLSDGVPKNRWSGLTHGGLSHLWQTYIPLGMGPFISSQAKRWAYFLPPYLPYPCSVSKPRHSQHSPDLSTCDQKRSSFVFCGMWCEQFGQTIAIHLGMGEADYNVVKKRKKGFMIIRAWLDTTWAYCHYDMWDLWLDIPPVRIF